MSIGEFKGIEPAMSCMIGSSFKIYEDAGCTKLVDQGQYETILGSQLPLPVATQGCTAVFAVEEGITFYESATCKQDYIGLSYYTDPDCTILATDQKYDI